MLGVYSRSGLADQKIDAIYLRLSSSLPVYKGRFHPRYDLTVSARPPNVSFAWPKCSTEYIYLHVLVEKKRLCLIMNKQ